MIGADRLRRIQGRTADFAALHFFQRALQLNRFGNSFGFQFANDLSTAKTGRNLQARWERVADYDWMGAAADDISWPRLVAVAMILASSPGGRLVGAALESRRHGDWASAGVAPSARREHIVAADREQAAHHLRPFLTVCTRLAFDLGP